MLKTYQSKTPCKGDIHSSKSLKLRISFCLDSWHNIGERRYVYKESGIQIQWHELFQQPPPPCGLWGCKNRPTPFPGRISYKATKPGILEGMSELLNKGDEDPTFGRFWNSDVL